LLPIFAKWPHCLKSIWNPPFGTSITLKFDKIELEVRKLWPLEVGGGVIFTKKIDQTIHSLFLIASKNLQIILLPLELEMICKA
jgi:hypothetical protein